MKIVVAGASGVVGRALIETCAGRRDVETIALSRNPLEFPLPGEFRAVDLLDADNCWRALSDLSDVTHLVYTAWQPGPSRAAEVAPNLSMLQNVLQVLDECSLVLRHVTLLQGAKAYGSHLGPFRTPARESDPRHMPPNFYYNQQDFLSEFQKGKAWSWTIFRPTTVYGFAAGSPMNLALIVAAYATISKELRLPLRFPGTERAYHALRQGVDAGLLAEAILWAGSTNSCRGEIFNITNGDHFRWAHVWPQIAAYFGLEVAEPQQIPLAEFMADKADLWRSIVSRYDLKRVELSKLVSWRFGESNFNREYDHILDTLKLRTFGFHRYDRTDAMFEAQFDVLRQWRVIP